MENKFKVGDVVVATENHTNNRVNIVKGNHYKVMFTNNCIKCGSQRVSFGDTTYSASILQCSSCENRESANHLYWWKSSRFILKEEFERLNNNNMKITIEKAAEQKPIKKYPYLGTHEVGSIVLFTSDGCGVLLEEGKDSYEVGAYRKDWLEQHFTPFNGTIKIEQ